MSSLIREFGYLNAEGFNVRDDFKDYFKNERQCIKAEKSLFILLKQIHKFIYQLNELVKY